MKRDDALSVARFLDVPMITIEYDVLSDENVSNNPDNRCYYCKKRVFSAIMGKAKADGFDTVIDGTNADDDALIQIVRAQDPLFEDNRDSIYKKLGEMYNTVTLDKVRRDE